MLYVEVIAFGLDKAKLNSRGEETCRLSCVLLSNNPSDGNIQWFMELFITENCWQTNQSSLTLLSLSLICFCLSNFCLLWDYYHREGFLENVLDLWNVTLWNLVLSKAWWRITITWGHSYYLSNEHWDKGSTSHMTYGQVCGHNIKQVYIHSSKEMAWLGSSQRAGIWV